ncbi:hypothetical protein [Thermoflavimicrobium dichotomicum]|uniref:Uncharacterized protein n=1 Tax=Thermoflavimicrobium dichotomicum TaxID=46223 RepID=A0A1I3T8T1_9BACL|nr:hypothetical protein [Thermoflavimicrobium dichotomicum]SFJ66066.1 hypothetical protein SAMN05421852_1168 [Thermoflavimicrobium dichotomicum]
MAKITEKDTKATILKALREAEKRIAELEKGKLDPVAETTAKKKTETITKANQIMEVDIEDKIKDLSKSVNSLLSKISEDIAEQKNNLKTVKEAIAIKEAELKELFGIEKEAHTLAGLVNAHQELKLAQEKELIEAKEKATAELNEIIAQTKKAREEYEALVKEQKEKLAQSQKRAEEEFKYNFERHKKMSHDKLEDELASRRKEFNLEMEKRNAELDTYKKSLDEREVAIQKREQKMNELEAEVAAFPQKLEEVKAEAEKKAEAEIKKVLAIREAALKREVEADRRILETERDNLKEQLARANETIATLQAKLDEAYKRIQEMGIQMVSSSNESKAFDKIAALVTEKNNK